MKVLFVCTGNTCRSPLAEAIARDVAAEHGLSGVEFASAGTGTGAGVGASDGSILVGMERGLDLGAHRTRPLTAELVADSDLILGMAPHHVADAVALGGADKSFLLDEYASGGSSSNAVSDPFGGELDGYRVAADSIGAQVRLLMERLAREKKT